MKATVGDWLVVETTHLNEPKRHGMILEVQHADGSPPYRVRWTDNEAETLFFPGPDARIVAGAELHEGDAHRS
jgi:uncharacterized protein DUF1918